MSISFTPEEETTEQGGEEEEQAKKNQTNHKVEKGEAKQFIQT